MLLLVKIISHEYFKVIKKKEEINMNKAKSFLNEYPSKINIKKKIIGQIYIKQT